MQLQDEPFDLKKANRSMILNMRNKMIEGRDGLQPLMGEDAFDAFLPWQFREERSFKGAHKPTGRRVELNAMTPKVFIKWLRDKLDENGCRKVRPPEHVVEERLLQSRRNALQNSVSKGLMMALGDDLIHEVEARIQVPSHDLDNLLLMKPEQHWEYLIDQCATRNLDLDAVVAEVVREKLWR